jgi:hypothetical protein
VSLFAAYLDASGEPIGYAVMSVAGMVAPISKWKRFEIEWREALDKEHIKSFHMTDFAASQGEFVGWKGDKERRRSFLRALTAIIKKNTNKFLMASIELDAWNSVNRSYQLEEKLHSPYALCGYMCVLMANKWAKGKGKRSSAIEYFFEDGDDGQEGLKKLCKRDGIEPLFQSKQKLCPFEAADLVAWKNRIACTNALKIEARGKQGESSLTDYAEINQELLSLNNSLSAPRRSGNLRRSCLNPDLR